MTELKLEKQSDLYSLLWHLSVCLHWIPVEFLWGLDMSQVTSKVWGTAVTSVTSIKRVRCPCWELPSFHNCSQGANSMSFFPGAPNLFVFTHTLPCRVNVGPSLYQVSSLKSTLTFWSWKPKKRVEAPKDVLWFWYTGVQVQIILFWARPTGELKQGILSALAATVLLTSHRSEWQDLTREGVAQDPGQDWHCCWRLFLC